MWFYFVFQLEQIGLEIREADASSKTSLKNRLQCYQAELKRLKQEFSKASKPDSETISMYESSDETRGQANLNDEQHRRLLDNSERIERSGNRLADGYRTILETEQLGTAVLQDLSHQRETLQRSRARVSISSSMCLHFNNYLTKLYLQETRISTFNASLIISFNARILITCLKSKFLTYIFLFFKPNYH